MMNMNNLRTLVEEKDGQRTCTFHSEPFPAELQQAFDLARLPKLIERREKVRIFRIGAGMKGLIVTRHQAVRDFHWQATTIDDTETR